MKKFILLSIIPLFSFQCAKDSALEFSPGKSGSITRFAVYQNYMYVLNLNEVQTYDLTDKEHPVIVHRLATDYGLETITIYDGTIFLGSNTALYILDISNPAAPKILSQSDRLFGLGFTGCDPVAVKGNYAYSTIKVIENICGNISAESALVVYDVTDKTNPLVLNVIPMSLPNGLGYKDNYLFVCDEGSDELTIFDISDPKNVSLANFSLSITDPVDLIVEGQKMIVSTKTNFQIFDISDITQIKKLGLISK